MKFKRLTRKRHPPNCPPERIEQLEPFFSGDDFRGQKGGHLAGRVAQNFPQIRVRLRLVNRYAQLPDAVQHIVRQDGRVEIEDDIGLIGKIIARQQVGFHPDFKTEKAVRGEFVRMVREADIEAGEREAILTVGLRALEGREDLDVN